MSSSAGSTPAAAVAAIYQLVRTANTCGLVATVMFVYDYVLCLDREYQYAWRSRKSKVSRLVYLYISCAVLTWCQICVGFLDLIGPAILTTLRTYVLSGKNKLLGGVAMILSLGPFVVNASTVYLRLPVNLPPPENCTAPNTESTAEAIGFTVAARTCAILADLITIVVTWRATRTSRKVLQDTFKQPSLQDILWTNGNIYFITLLFGNLLDLILITLSITDPQPNGNWVVEFLDLMTTILNCRFLLDLYETNARLERGGTSLSQSNIDIGSLHFTGIGGPEGDSPEDSPFLSSFSGPVLHSFPDDDMALDTADDEPKTGPSVPAQTTALLAADVTETVAEGSGSTWTADTAGCSPVVGESGVAGGSELAV